MGVGHRRRDPCDVRVVCAPAALADSVEDDVMQVDYGRQLCAELAKPRTASEVVQMADALFEQQGIQISRPVQRSHVGPKALNVRLEGAVGAIQTLMPPVHERGTRNVDNQGREPHLPSQQLIAPVGIVVGGGASAADAHVYEEGQPRLAQLHGTAAAGAALGCSVAPLLVLSTIITVSEHCIRTHCEPLCAPLGNIPIPLQPPSDSVWRRQILGQILLSPPQIPSEE